MEQSRRRGPHESARVIVSSGLAFSTSDLVCGYYTRRFFINRLGDELVAVWARLAAHHGHGVSNPAQGRHSGGGHLRPWGLSDPAPDSPPVAQPHAFVVAAALIVAAAAGRISKQKPPHSACGERYAEPTRVGRAKRRAGLGRLAQRGNS